MTVFPSHEKVYLQFRIVVDPVQDGNFRIDIYLAAVTRLIKLILVLSASSLNQLLNTVRRGFKVPKHEQLIYRLNLCKFLALSRNLLTFFLRCNMRRKFKSQNLHNFLMLRIGLGLTCVKKFSTCVI